jgi:hypothetical protein
MQSNRARALVALGVIAAAVVLFVVLNGGDDGGSKQQAAPAGTTVETTGATGATGSAGRRRQYVIVVENGKPVGGIKKMEYAKDERVRFVVRSDVADEVHVHGYDRIADVAAGGSVRFNFPARIEGVFEIELEQRKEQIAELRVNPS